MRYALAILTAVVAFGVYFVVAFRAYTRGSEITFLACFAGGALALGLITAGAWYALGVFGVA